MDDLVPPAQERLSDQRGPAHADARAVVDHMLSHYAKYKFVVGPTVHAALVDALLSTTFQHLAQTLADAAAPTGVILHFRRQWQCFHRPPEETSYGPAVGRGFCEALVQPTFGAAVALLVDTLNVSDDVLDALIIVWRKQRGVRVSEPGDSILCTVPPSDLPANSRASAVRSSTVARTRVLLRPWQIRNKMSQDGTGLG
ncbi:hypothetical protein B0H13DRAFT_2317599 [Mycena leptocephala]|nr:hypothetical protein B0H13DRAFT_2317599 [Mycena leptocephala]